MSLYQQPYPRSHTDLVAYTEFNRSNDNDELRIGQLVRDLEAVHGTEIQDIPSGIRRDLVGVSPHACARLAVGLVFAEDAEEVRTRVITAREERQLEEEFKRYEQERGAFPEWQSRVFRPIRSS